MPPRYHPKRREPVVSAGSSGYGRAVVVVLRRGDFMEQEERIEGGVSGYLESLRRERDRFVALAFCAADLLLEVDAANTITFAAGATQSLVGRSPEDLKGTSFTDLIAPENRILMDELIRGMMPGSRLDPVPIRLTGESGVTPPLSVTGYHLPDLPGCFFFALGLGAAPVNPEVMRDLRRDPGTGLLDKDSFAELATERMQEAARRGEDLKLTMLRTPNFTEFRSRLDKEASESLSRTLGACLQASSAAGGTAGRFDDENYGLVHKPTLDVGGVQDRLSDLIKAADPKGIGIPVTAGTVDAAPEGMNEEDSLRVLLYTVNRFCQTDGEIPDMTSLSKNLARMSRETSQKMAGFRKLSKTGDFAIAFQPIVSLDTEAVHHFEALARFDDNVESSPYNLITFAENTGLICDFDLAMCRKLLNWLRDSNKAGKRYTVAANLSGRSLGNTAFVVALHDLLKQFGALREQIMFEITESAQISDLEMANRFIQGLRKAGHQVCLDDFGAGSAALKYLHSLEVDVVKIDGQYVRSALTTNRYRAFLKAVVGLCRDLSISTIAEMVEDTRCVDMLKVCQVEYAQGYMFGRPSFEIGNFERTEPKTKIELRKSAWR